MTQITMLFLSILLAVSCQNKSEILTVNGNTMGTTYTLKYIANQLTPPKENLHGRVEEILKSVNSSMSTYMEDSQISKFNRLEAGKPFPVTDDIMQVLLLSADIAAITNGYYDPTIGPLVNLWGFGPSAQKKRPSAQAIAQVKKYVGIDKLIIDTANGFIQKRHPELYLDLSASAKGYAVDQIVQYLRSVQLNHFMVEIGGEVYTMGQNGDRPWKIGIQSPDLQAKGEPYSKIVPLKNMAMATSGDYRNFYYDEGKKYSHTIDFQTGAPVESNLASVTVLDPKSCMKADAWATAFMAMGLENAKIVANQRGIPAYFIYREGNSFKELYAGGFLKVMK